MTKPATGDQAGIGIEDFNKQMKGTGFSAAPAKTDGGFGAIITVPEQINGIPVYGTEISEPKAKDDPNF